MNYNFDFWLSFFNVDYKDNDTLKFFALVEHLSSQIKVQGSGLLSAVWGVS